MPNSFPEFAKRFATEESCVDYLVKVRWPNGYPTHPRDGSLPVAFLKTRGLWEFREGYQMSVKVGTVMERSHLPFLTWFWAAYWVGVHTPGVSAMQLAKHLDLRYQTAFTLLHRLRAGLIDPDREMLRGTLEVDEAYIGGRSKKGRGRGSEGKTLVVGAVEIKRKAGKHGQDTGGRIRLEVVPTHSSEFLCGFIRKNIRGGSYVATDGLGAYESLTGYRHRRVFGLTNIEVAERMPHIHYVFSNLKEWLQGTHHGVSAKHLQSYLNEFVFRRNRRSTPFSAFRSVLRLGAQRSGPTDDQLYRAGKRGGWKHPTY